MQHPPPPGRIRYRMLGTIEVVNTEGIALASLAARPKALALLAFLAIETRAGPCTRDTVLGLFWPDSTMAQARHALRQALYELRQELGSDVIETRGQQDLLLRRSAFTADVLEVLDALDGGRLDDALELYRGELLPGLHFADESSEFLGWLDDARERVRRRMTDALWEAARAAVAAKDPESAIRRGRRALELDPYNEAGLRGVLEAMRMAGRDAEAVVLYRRFRARLAEDLDLTCSEETKSLAGALGRPSSGVGLATHVAEDEAGTDGDGPVGVADAVSPPRRDHRTALTVAGAILALAAGAAGIVAWGGGGEMIAAVYGGSATDPDPGSATAMIRFQSPAQDPLAGAAVSGALEWMLSGQPGLTGRTVVGRVRQSGPGWIAEAVVPVPGGESRQIDVRVAGDLIALARVLGDSIAAALAPSSDSLRRGVLPIDESALRAHVRGEWLLERGEVHAAADAFGRAIELDPAFALGHHRLAVAAGLAFDRETARQAEAMALALQEQLPEAEARIIEARRAYRMGSPEDAEGLIRSVLVSQPEHPEALFQMAELLFHFNPLRGRPLREARPALERASTRTAGRAESLYHLAQTALLVGDTVGFDTTSARMLALAPAGFRNAQVRALRARTTGTAEEWRRELAGLAGALDLVVLSAAHNHAVYGADIPAALAVLAILTHPHRDPGVRARAHAARADLFTAAGRPTEVAAELRSALAIDPLIGASRAAHLLTTGALPPADTALLAIAADIIIGRPLATRTTSTWIAVETALAPWLEPHARAMAALAVGDPGPATRLTRELAAARRGGRAERLLLADLEVRLGQAAADHDPEGAALVIRGVSPEEAIISPLYSRPLARIVVGRIDRDLDRLRLAERWFASLLEHSLPDLALAAVALGELGRTAEQRGDPLAARRFDERLARLQAEAEPGYLEWRDRQEWAPRFGSVVAGSPGIPSLAAPVVFAASTSW